MCQDKKSAFFSFSSFLIQTFQCNGERKRLKHILLTHKSALNRSLLEHESDFRPGKSMGGREWGEGRTSGNKITFVSTRALEKCTRRLINVDT